MECISIPRLLTRYVDLPVVHGSRVGGQRLRQRRQVVPLVGLQVVGLHAGQVAALVSTAHHVQVLLQAAGEETGSPEDGQRQTSDDMVKAGEGRLEQEALTSPASGAAESSC